LKEIPPTQFGGKLCPFLEVAAASFLIFKKKTKKAKKASPVNPKNKKEGLLLLFN
jgi:hypothetical protein